ncbi:MAG: hypothetical protein ACR2RE_31780, partial [Geminicoccaceae bacterium]
AMQVRLFAAASTTTSAFFIDANKTFLFIDQARSSFSTLGSILFQAKGGLAQVICCILAVPET